MDRFLIYGLVVMWGRNACAVFFNGRPVVISAAFRVNDGKAAAAFAGSWFIYSNRGEAAGGRVPIFVAALDVVLVQYFEAGGNIDVGHVPKGFGEDY